jgi:arginyl-tRNA synthetase
MPSGSSRCSTSGKPDGWGRGEAKLTPKLCVEYLSANPTGPLHFAHGRHAAVGDSLTRLLRFAGYEVVREFYLNDAGNQVVMLALSVWTRYMEAVRASDASVPEVTFPENGYRGDYIRGIGRQLLERDGKRWVGASHRRISSRSRHFAIQSCLAMIRETLARFDVQFDVWQSERALHEAGEVKATLEHTRQGGIHRAQGQRGLAAHHGLVGRRQGSRGGEVRRSAHLLVGGHRVPPKRSWRADSTNCATSGARTITATFRACRRR